jgi:hypothetical protein
MPTKLRTTAPVARLALTVVACTFLGALFAAGGSSDPRPAADNKYIGADKCKGCHGNAESGDQYGHWKGMKHARAFEVLASDEAKKLAAERGIADPQKSDECVRCHVTAFGVPEDRLKKGFDRSHGVQCETCHGPGELHMKARFAAAAKGDAPQGYVQVPADEIVTSPKQELCLECHNKKSPSYQEFCFHEFNAKIRHLNPKKPRAAIDLGTCSCPKCASGCPESCKALAKPK